MSTSIVGDASLFQVGNHHSAECGIPPHIDDVHPNQYLGYFENQYGEQAVFVYDRGSCQAILYLGDAGWEMPHTVVDGAVPDLLLSEIERLWMDTRVLASRHCKRQGGMNNDRQPRHRYHASAADA